jgi:hypothetical protein
MEKRYLSSLVAFCLLLFLQMASLPVNPGFLFMDSHASPMTVNCGNKTCCTPLCYLDENGKHHCVHMTEDSHGYGAFGNAIQSDSDSILISSTLPAACAFLPPPVASGWAGIPNVSFDSLVAEPPSPPPRVTHLS